MSSATFDKAKLQKLFQCHAKLIKLKEDRKCLKEEMQQDDKYIIEWLLAAKCRFIDSSGKGSGPFWTLCKDKNSAQFKRELYMVFFENMFKQLRTPGQNPAHQTPQFWTEAAIKFLQTHEKRKICLKPLTRPPMVSGVEDLVAWRNKT
jgi:hypothetical protein